jgi:large subunit ribosomal protein L21
MATHEQAIVRTGGKQYRVEPGSVIKVEKLDLEVGSKIEIDDVLLVGKGASVQVGTPKIAGAKVSGTVTYQGRAKKLIVYKFRRRKNYRRKAGHRQYYTEIKVDQITA